MRIEMNYLNDDNVMEKVDILGFVDSSRKYCEAYKEDIGYLIVPTDRLYPIREYNKCIGYIFAYEDGYCVKDKTGKMLSTYTTSEALLDWCSEQENIGEILDRIINK